MRKLLRVVATTERTISLAQKYETQMPPDSSATGENNGPVTAQPTVATPPQPVPMETSSPDKLQTHTHTHTHTHTSARAHTHTHTHTQLQLKAEIAQLESMFHTWGSAAYSPFANRWRTH